MGVFTSQDHFYSVLVPFFGRLKDDPGIGPRVLQSGLVIKFVYRKPDAVIFIDCPGDRIIQGDDPLAADVTMTMDADVAHRFWLGKINLMVALTKREIVAKGPVPKIMMLLPIIKDSYAMYRVYLQEIGMDAGVDV